MHSNKYVISYDLGYHDWYVSEFYKYFHHRLIDEANVEIEFVPLNVLAEQRGASMSNHDSNSLFNWYNLIIFNKKTEKYFIHNWSDNSPMMIEYCMNNNINLTSFSCVSNVKNDSVIDKWKHKVEINPSVYCLANWSDHEHIKKASAKTDRKHKVFFNGLVHSHRQIVMNLLNQNSFFDLRSRNDNFKLGFEYFDQLSDYKFGLSLNGAAHICYRDLELFGLNVLNLREPFRSKTHDPVIKDVHYFELINDELLMDIFNRPENAILAVNEKLDQLEQFINTDGYLDMTNEANVWFNNNVLPENQFNIIYSFLKNFTVLD